jgi:hypothetical protein
MTVHSRLNAEIVFHEQEGLAYRARRCGRFGVPVAAAGSVEPVAALTIRLAHSGDAAALARLAELDGAGVPAAPALIAELGGGRAIAALSLSSHAVVADPFVATADIVVLLRLRAAQLLGAGGGGRPRWLRLAGAVRGLARVRGAVAARQ